MSARLLLALVAVALVGCERPPMKSTQEGYRGTGMVQIDNPRILAKQQAAVPAVPLGTPPAPTEGPKARDVFQNVKVLGDLSVAEFTRHMTAITQWVSPEQGCTYCHTANLAEDTLYTKVVSRRMIELTRHLNGNWTDHVKQTGVTCYTCHRGKPVPDYVSFTAQAAKYTRVGMSLGDDAGQNKGEPSIALASLPYDPITPFLVGDGSATIRVQGLNALPTPAHRTSIKQTEWTYSLMNHISKSLGVNCTHCHNTQSFSHWNQARVQAWHGIRMARDINNGYLVPLTQSFPAERLGPTGDVAKVSCTTCHQGVAKPLGGLQMAKDYVGLTAVAAPAAAAAAATAAPAAAPLPAPVAEARKAVMYFAVGSPALDAAQAKAIEQVVATLGSQRRAVASISGYHSASGDLAQNQELAKQRAGAVRDALTAAGVAANRVRLEKPQQTEANVAGEDATARRVEVTVR